jgi:CMP-N-acetylneuraminic acid synthetase
MIVGLLTGRGGNSTLPDKNVFPVLGQPLMSYVAASAFRAQLLDRIFVSTEDPKIKAVGADLGLEIIDRPEEFARPDSQHDECLVHAVEYLADKGVEVEILVVLMCNVGIQPEEKIDECVQALLDDPELDAAVTVREWGDHHPTRAKRASDDGLLSPILDVDPSVTTTRQLLGNCYYLDHQVWALRVSRCFKGDGQPPWSFMGKIVKGIPNGDIVVDVHGMDEIRYTELWLRGTSEGQ